MNRLFALLLALTALTACAARADDAPEARIWSDAAGTRLVLEGGRELLYTVSVIDNPPRLLIDIETAADPALINRLPAPANAYLKNMRAGRFDRDTLRVVFDLAAVIHYRVHPLKPVAPYRHRLVIDITPQPPADPLLALLESLDAPRPPPDDKRPFVVLIDPGHGGEDPGAVSPNNRYEKHVVLAVSKLLAGNINRRPGMKAVLSRDSDRFIPLFERVHLAHRRDVDAFVSIHADSVKSRKARGSSVFILSERGASSKFARRMAEKANLSDLIGGEEESARDPQLDSALRQFSKDGKDRASRRLAELILANLGAINKLHSRHVESAGFAVLKSPSIPSVLVETAFISNPVEEKKLHSKKFQQQLAEAIGDALHKYSREHHITR